MANSQDNGTKVLKAPEGRVNRKPIGQGNILEVKGQLAGYKYRIVSATTQHGYGRIENFLEAGYSFASDGESVSGKKHSGGTTELNLMGGDKGYLMKIPLEYFEEDQANKIKAIEQQENMINDRAEESMNKFKSRSGGLRRD